MIKSVASCSFSGEVKMMMIGAATPTMLTVLPTVRKRLNLTIACPMGSSEVNVFFAV